MRWWQLDQVALLERDLFPSDAWSVEQFWQELAHDTRSYVTATMDGTLVGYAGAFILAPDSDVQTIAVDSTVQGGGVGSRLLRELMDIASGRGAATMMLEVRADNDSAVSLYTRHAFEIISRRTRYYPDGADALIMRRRLVA
jgi:ribosomal-protein-alanine N-acetyltransferase